MMRMFDSYGEFVGGIESILAEEDFSPGDIYCLLGAGFEQPFGVPTFNGEGGLYEGDYLKETFNKCAEGSGIILRDGVVVGSDFSWPLREPLSRMMLDEFPKYFSSVFFDLYDSVQGFLKSHSEGSVKLSADAVSYRDLVRRLVSYGALVDTTCLGRIVEQVCDVRVRHVHGDFYHLRNREGGDEVLRDVDWSDTALRGELMNAGRILLEGREFIPDLVYQDDLTTAGVSRVGTMVSTARVVIAIGVNPGSQLGRLLKARCSRCLYFLGGR